MNSRSSTTAGAGSDHTIIDAHAGDDLSPLVGRWQVDPSHSALEFVARYAVFTRVRGRFTSFAGTVIVERPHPASARIEVEIDASSVDTAMALRDAHVRGEDFLDVSRHPLITFRSRGATLLGPGRFTVHGDLVIRGIAQPVNLLTDLLGRAPDVLGNPRIGLRAVGKVRRNLWGITWNAPVRGCGVVLAEDIDLELDVSLIPADAPSHGRSLLA